MKLHCLNCGHNFEGFISFDAYGWHSSCPACDGSFDVDVGIPTQSKYIIAFADDEDDSCFSDDILEAKLISVNGYASARDFIQAWENFVEHPESMWYFCLIRRNDEVGLDKYDYMVTGACDPNDIEAFAESGDPELEAEARKSSYFTGDDEETDDDDTDGDDTGLEIDRMLTLSTAHVTKGTAALLDAGKVDLASYKTEYGWFIHLPDFLSEYDIPSDLKACAKFAKKHGCIWLHFDRDADTVDELSKYGW